MTAQIRNWALLNPLARLALAGLAGAILADKGFGRSHEVLVLAAGFSGCVFVLAFPRRFPPEVPALFVFAFIHLVRLNETTDHPLRATLEPRSRAEALVTAYLTPVVPLRSGDAGDSQQVTLDATLIELPAKGRRLSGTTRLRGWMTSKERLPPPGTYEVRGRLRLPRGPTNPAEFDSAAYSLRQGFVADMDVRSVRLLKADPLPLYTWFLTGAESSRDWIGSQLEKGVESEDQPNALIRGMVLGLTDETSIDLQRPFRQTGTLHVFSVSGLHVALISSIGWICLSACGVRRSPALLLLIPSLFVYAFITGWHPPAARAAIMITVFLAATWFDRRARLQNSLGGAALALLAVDTQPAFTAGFQLSFGVLWAIALLASPLLRLFRPWSELDPFLPPQLASQAQRLQFKFRSWVASTVSVSTAASLGSLPLMLWHFGLATPVSVFANCLLIPLAFGALASACVSLGSAAFHLGTAQVLSNNTCWLLAKSMLGGALIFSKIPGAWFIWHPGLAGPKAPLELTVLHLPYGEAAQHLRVGDRHWLLDAGTKRSFARVVQPVLQHEGADRLAGLVLSHSDIEHVGGAVRASDEYASSPLFLGCQEPWPLESSGSSLKRCLALRRAAADPPPRILAGDDQLDFGLGTRATVLYPTAKDLHDKSDDRALMLLIDLGGFRILWCGDGGFVGEKAVMERHLLKSLRCDVLIRNQHTADFSALSEFLLAARPRLIVTSNVPYLSEETMQPSLAHYARNKRAALLDQDVHGAVTLRVENDRLVANCFVTGETITLDRRR